MHVAVLTSTEEGADAVLAEAVATVRATCGWISVMAVYQPMVVSCGIGFAAAGVIPPPTRDQDRVVACELARRFVDRLPADVRAMHAGFLGWRCPELLRFLRSGDVDRVLVAGWPLNPLARWAVLRAARSGGSPISRPAAPCRAGL
jgi:hypothetical protein